MPQPASSPSPSFTSALFSSASLSQPSAALLTADWSLSPLFRTLAAQMRKEEYEYDVLVACKQLILGLQRDEGGDAGGADTAAAAAAGGYGKGKSGSNKRKEEAEEEEEDDEEEAARATAAGSGAASASPEPSSTVSVHPLDDALLSPPRREKVDPLASLPPSQARAFQALAALIREQLSYLPSHSAPPPTVSASPAADGGEQLTTVSFSAAVTQPPIVRPHDGDVMGLFLISLLLSSPSRAFAQSCLLLLELLGSVSNLKVALRRLLELLQRPCAVQPPPNLSNSALDGLDISSSSPAAFLTPHLTPSSFLPVMLMACSQDSEVIARYELRPVCLRLLQAVLTDSIAVTSPLTSHSPLPSVWYQFTDTPLFPKVSRLLPSAASSSGSGSVPSIHTHGYSWQTFVCLTAVRDAPNNIFRFFNDTGFGLQAFVRGRAIAVRTLPNTSDAFVLSGGELEEGKWMHIAVTHKPMPRPPPQQQQMQPPHARRAFAAGAGGAPLPPPHLAAASPHPQYGGVFVAVAGGAPSPSSSSVPYTALSPVSGPGSPQSAAVAHNTRPGRLTLYVDGQPASTSDVPYPNLENSDNLQCTLGGLYGCMSSFYLLADVLAPPVIAALHSLGAAQFAVPAMHVINAGLVAVFPPPPSSTSAVAAHANSAASPAPPASSAAASTARVAASSTRTVARCLLAQSPAQTTHSVCLPSTWPDDPPAALPQTPLTAATPSSSSAASAAINQCLHHTLRLDGTTVVYRTQNAQTFAAIGGLKLLLLCCSPSYYGEAFHSEEEASELLLLLAGLVLSSESNAHLLLEIGAATFKQSLLEHCKRRHRSLQLLAAMRRFLLAVNLIDQTAERSHFASFTSALLLDFAFWRQSGARVQLAAVRLLRLLMGQVQAPFVSFPSLGVPRLLDNLVLLNAAYLQLSSPPSQAPSAMASPVHAAGAKAEDPARESSLFSVGSEREPVSPTPSLSLLPASPAVPSSDEVAVSAALLEAVLALAKSSLSSPSYERDIIAPFLHLIQVCQASSSVSVEQLLSGLLRCLLSIIAQSSHRTLSFLHSQQAHYVFLRLLYSDSVAIRALGLRLLAFLNVFCIRQEKLERDKKAALELNQLQADIAQAIVSALSLFPVGQLEHDCLWEILMGQPPHIAEAETGSGAAAGSAASASSATSSGVSVEAGVTFCHPAFLSMILELSLLSPLPIQSRVLLDVLTLLRTNPANVDGLAALFWQRLLLPFSSRMHHNPALAAYLNSNQLSSPSAASSSAQHSLPASPSSSAGSINSSSSQSLPSSPSSALPASASSSSSASESAEAAAVTPQTVDQLVHQILNLMLLNCFAESDTRILTNYGLLFLDEIEKKQAEGREVLFGCYEEQSKALLYSKGNIVYFAPPQELVEFTSHGEAAQWAEGSGDYGAEGAAEDRTFSRHVSLRVTPGHDMYVQLGDACVSGHVSWPRTTVDGARRPAAYCKMQAQALLSTEPCEHVRLLACAQAGYAPQHSSQHRAVQRDLRLNNTQFAAFLELLGFWLADGSLQYRNSGGSRGGYDAVAFAQVKKEELDWLKGAAFPQAGLRPSHWSSDVYGVVEHLLITDKRWFAFFDKEFGAKSRCSQRISPPGTQPETTESVKHLPDWALQELSAAEMRLLIRGLHRADGSWAGGVKGISTSSARFRDQLMQALLHCGYSACPLLMHRKGAIRGYVLHDQSKSEKVCSISRFKKLSAAKKLKYDPITARVDAWQVTWSELDPVLNQPAAASCWPSLPRQQCVKRVPYSAARDRRIWCVEVEHADHLIIAQRAHRGPDGRVTKQSRPIVVGNCLINEPKGWQVLDQSIWCLQEKNSLLAAMPPQVQQLTGVVTLARTVHDTWLLEMSLLHRLFHSLHRHVRLLSGRRSDSVAVYNEQQVSNLRRNMLAVFELTEWILFHSPCSFLTAPTQLALGVPDVDKLPVATRADNQMDDATRDEAIREMLSANAEAQQASSSDELPGGGIAGGAEEAETERSELKVEAEGDTSSTVTDDSADFPRSVSSSSTASSSSIASASSASLSAFSALKSDSLPSSATILRASQRGPEEPLTAEEIEIFTVLLSGIVEQFPMPEKRQDVLRVTFRYLMVVLPHPLCAPLTAHICDMVRLLFLERVVEKLEKNSRLVALTLGLLKTGMEAAIRRQDLHSVDAIKRCIGQLYASWGDIAFLENFTPQVHAAQWAPPSSPASLQHPQRFPPPTAPPAQAEQTAAPTPLPTTATAPAAAASDGSAAAAAASAAGESGSAASAAAADPIDEACEAALFRLYQGEGRAVMQSTQTVFLQHQQRFSYLSEVRAAKVHASIVDYLRRKRHNEAQREKKFSLGSTTALRQSAAARPFLLPHYAMKRGRPVTRLSEKEEKQLARVAKAVKHFRGQAMNSRPLPLPLPPPHPDLLRSHLQTVKAMLDSGLPHAAAAPASGQSLRSLSTHSRLVEYWRLDSTESPTRMRRLLKKNFSSGDPHTFASANAVANAAKQQQAKEQQTIDLMKVKLLSARSSEQQPEQGVDANADVEDKEKDKEAAKQAEVEKARLLAAAEAEDDDGGGDDEDEVSASQEQDGDDDDVDDDADDSSASAAAARVRRSSKTLLAHFATMITPTHKFIGVMKISTTAISFSGWEQLAPPGAETATSASPPPLRTEDEDAAAAQRRRKVKVREKHLRWSLKQLRMVLPRFFLLRESALEVFLNNFKNFFFNFTPLPDDVLLPLLSLPAYSALHAAAGLSRGKGKWKSGREQRNEVYKLLCTLVSDMQFELSPGRRLLKSGIMKAWQRGEVSNFDYLMHLNTIAGRSYNDINQYPVFPWVLTDYRSASIDLDDPAVYRDLSRPIGALNPERFAIFAERFASFEDETIPPFLYGSHYSSAGIALHFLIRCEPFTSLAISLQGGRFDLPDRLFDSIAGSWELSYANMADVKELIPEFFYQADFLRNVNHLDLGTKQDASKLGDVVLPPWAATPEEFVRINREALESEHVSAHLHEWIDLIFGFKQRGKAAVDADNVFFYLTYAGSVDIDSIDNVALRKATEDQIANFGQTPMQLLTSPHPRRLSAAERSRAALGRINLPLRLPFSYTSQLICNYQVPRKRKTAGGKGGDEALPVGGEEERKQLLASLPTTICFTQHDVVIAVTPSLAVQSHVVAAFVNSPPTLLYPAHEQMQGIWQSERETSNAAAGAADSSGRGSAGSGQADSWQAVQQERRAARAVNRRGVGQSVDPAAPLSPSAAQFVPSSVIASHVICPMCPHWFLSPVPLPSAVSSSAATPASSSSSAEQKSRALAPHSGRELYFPAVSCVAKNAKFLFSGGYFDGSLKVHALVHSKAHIEGEGGMGGGQQSQHVMAALAAKSHDPYNLQRPPVKTQPTLDVRPLSSVRQHRAVVTALTLSSNQTILLSGDADGVVCIWRTFLDRQERSRPPVASTPLASFAVHEGPVVALDTNTVIGIAVSLAKDVQRRRGCELAVYSMRGGSARFVHSIVVHDPSVDLQLCTLTATASIVLYGLQDRTPTLWLYSLNGALLTSVLTHDVLSVLCCSPNLSRTVNANDGFVVTGGRRGQVVFRAPHNLEPVQTFFTDDQFPHTAPHGLPSSASTPTAAASSTSVPPDTGDEPAAATGEGGGSESSASASSSPPVSAEDWTLVQSRQADGAAQQKRLQAEAAAAALRDPPDALLESIYCDPTLELRMGIAAVDVSRGQKHFVAAVWPDPDLVSLQLMQPSHPLASLYSADSSASTAEGRLLLFPLPFSQDPVSFLGFYVDYASTALDDMRDAVSAAMFSRISETRDAALEAVERARDRLGQQRDSANKKMGEVRSKVIGAFSSIFGSKKPNTGSTSSSSSALQQQQRPAEQPIAPVARPALHGAPPVARAVPRPGANM